MPNREKKKKSLTGRILLALLLGIGAGLLLQNHAELADSYIQPFGTIFLNLIKMIVVPVVLFSIIQGVISLKDIRKMGSIGGRTVLFYFCTTAFAISLGLVFANVLRVGSGFDLSGKQLQEYDGAVQAPPLMETLVNIFPSNAVQPLADAVMLQTIVIALFFGCGIILAGEKGKAAAGLADSLAEVCMKIMEIIIRLSPVGVFALITPVIADNGAAVLLPLMKLIGVVYLAGAVHMLAVYSGLLKLIAGIGPVRFFRGMGKAILFAFSSASSVGTLPFNMECTQELGARKEIASFVLPLGCTINMDGTAIYQGVSAVFIAQIFGIALTPEQQLMIILTATLASVGTAGVPGSGVVMLAMVLQSAGLPLEGIALVAGVDRILDMARTTVNITGDAVCALCVDAMERRQKK